MTQSTLNDAYDGYNTLIVSLNGTVCQSYQTAGCTSYNQNGAAPTATCNDRQLVFPTQVIDGLNVSRRDYVPTDDHFERTLNVFDNTTNAPLTVTMATANNLGSDNQTKITGTSAGGTTAADGDEWVTTFQNFSGGNTTSDPRLGHVLGTTGAAVGATSVTFQDGNDNPYWAYSFTLAPGQTMIFANYAVADGTIAESEADSARLAALPATALECMSATDESELANMGTAPTVTTQPVAGTTFTAAATAVGLDQTPTVQWQISTDGGGTWTNVPGATLRDAPCHGAGPVSGRRSRTQSARHTAKQRATRRAVSG